MAEVVERKLTALNESKLRIFGEPVNGARRSPWIGVSVFRNNPRLEVQTNVEGDKNYGFINGNLDAASFFMMAKVLDWVIAHDGPTQRRVTNGTGPLNEIVPASTIYLGKDDEGCIYISVIDADKDRPKIKFIFTPSNYHTLTDGQGGALSKAEISQFHAAGWMELICRLLPVVLGNDYIPPPPRDDKPAYQGKKQWNNNDGGQKKQWNSGGGNKPAHDNNAAPTKPASDGNWGDDDFPM